MEICIKYLLFIVRLAEKSCKKTAIELVFDGEIYGMKLIIRYLIKEQVNDMASNNITPKKLSKGVYFYRGYTISNCGYHAPDRCVWWEAVNMDTGCADFHAHTKKRIIEMIDNEKQKGETSKK